MYFFMFIHWQQTRFLLAHTHTHTHTFIPHVYCVCSALVVYYTRENTYTRVGSTKCLSVYKAKGGVVLIELSMARSCGA